MRTVTMIALDGRKSGTVQFNGKSFEIQPNSNVEVDAVAAPSLLGAGFTFYTPSVLPAGSPWLADPGDLSAIFETT